MDDYKIADSESIKKINEEYSKLKNENKVQKLSLENQEKIKNNLTILFDNLHKEKQLICFFSANFNNLNPAVKQCTLYLKDIFCFLDLIEVSYNFDYTFTSPMPRFSLKSFFEFNYEILQSINTLKATIKNEEVICNLCKIKESQIDIMLIILPFLF